MGIKRNAQWLRGQTIILLLAVALLAAACTEPAGSETAGEYPWEGRPVDMGIISGDSIAWFQHHVYKKLMEELGYDVTLHPPVGAPIFYLSAARGELDFWANGWFPLYNSYIEDEQVAGKVESVGYIVKAGGLQGYLIDKKTAEEYDITNLEQLKDPEIARLFDTDGDGKADLIGCNPGWGCELVVDHHLPEYELTDTVNHVKGEYFALMAQTLRRFKREEPILYYTWTPNWTVNELEPGTDVVWLNVPYSSLPEEQKEQEEFTTIDEDIGCATTPCNMGFPANDIRVDANSQWLAENPAARALFEAAELPLSAISEAAMLVNDGATEEDVAVFAGEWIEENRDLIDPWLEEARRVGTEEEGR